MKSVGIIGLGYVGLPLAVQVASKGYTVHGVDLQSALVKKVNSRQVPFVNDARFQKAYEAIPGHALTASNDYDSVASMDVIVICVPTPTINNLPDLSYVIEASTQVGCRLRKGQLVVLESTVSPGTTRDHVLPILEKLSGLTVGKDFFLAYCPERVDPGNATYFVGNINRVIAGITRQCTVKAMEFYNNVIDASIVMLDTTEEAEFVKSWENTYRNIMIALANEAAIISDAFGMNVDNILIGMQSKIGQFGLGLAKPGLGPGGHCIPEDIHYVIQRAKSRAVDTQLLEESALLNESMPKYAVDQLEKMIALEEGSLKDLTVGLLGMSYKPNVMDARRSPALVAGKLLAAKAKKLYVHDPYVSTDTVIVGAERVSSLTRLLEKVDVNL